MYTTLDEIIQTFIKATLEKKNTSVLALKMFYETRANNHKRDYILLSCVIHTIIQNYVYIDYLACQSKSLSEIPVGSRGGSIHPIWTDRKSVQIG